MTQERSILILDSDASRQESVRLILEFVGDSVVAGDPGKLPDADTVLALLVAGEAASGKALAAYKAWDPAVPVLVIDGDLSGADESTMYEPLTWPLRYNDLVDALHRAEVWRAQQDRNRERGQRRDVLQFRSLVGASRSVSRVRDMMSQVADKEVTVLITGESGTGKEVVARNLHFHSPRKDKPFVPINCGAIPGELLESELFGHEKGAFTGAISARAGRFELAAGGTIFLDEIGDMPLNMQVKILRVLQERTFERVGGSKQIEADVRVIAATHRDLEKMIEEGTFREDLYYRLNVFPIEMPPLRERSEDIPLLINELVSRMENEEQGSLRFNSAAILSLCRHEWPGNVRELANLVERLVIMQPFGTVGVRDLPAKYRHVEDDEADALEEEELPEPVSHSLPPEENPALLPLNGLNLKEHIEEIEKALIEQALDDEDGVVARAAEKLQLRRTTLVEKMKKYSIQR